MSLKFFRRDCTGEHSMGATGCFWLLAVKIGSILNKLYSKNQIIWKRLHRYTSVYFHKRYELLTDNQLFQDNWILNLTSSVFSSAYLSNAAPILYSDIMYFFFFANVCFCWDVIYIALSVSFSQQCQCDWDYKVWNQAESFLICSYLIFYMLGISYEVSGHYCTVWNGIRYCKSTSNSSSLE